MRLPAYLPARLPAWSLTATPTATATARRDRAPYITTLRNGTASTIPAWNFINGNFFLANYNPSLAIDNDDGSSFWQHHGNFIVYGQAGLKFDFGAHDMRAIGNYYAYIDVAYVVTPSPQLRSPPLNGGLSRCVFTRTAV